ncbi:MAG TPA: hypothetical protein VKR26_03995 [Terriglobales bacterium]|nr:hypothetical protein [Terriglobales bacterium]
MPIKRLIDVRRRRKAPPRGFGWIDHRLLREGYVGRCSVQALALYLLLVCAADAQGLSYYSDTRAAALLGLEKLALLNARRELILLGLITYERPLYQLLSLEREPQMPDTDAGTEPENVTLFSMKAAVLESLRKAGTL